ncbi:hypothetical protein M513_12761 [Trichuris suis]|uniref:Uncharacterized protein n=1 Tax=Trichuris suis TaxID=68888 RepID=A0A085LMZ9_9BILA|nr:hypothetical protein M513_12761 [Trichuris suis]
MQGKFQGTEEEVKFAGRAFEKWGKKNWEDKLPTVGLYNALHAVLLLTPEWPAPLLRVDQVSGNVHVMFWKILRSTG